MPRKKQWNEWKVCERRIEALPQERRDEARVLQLLDRSDRELLAMWAGGQVSHAALARVLGCHAGTVTRRLRRLRARLNDAAAQTIARYGGELSPTRRLVAVRVFVRGEVPSRVAHALGINQHEMTLTLAEVMGWVQARRAFESEATESGAFESQATESEVSHAA